jgi:subtilisin family serine protease
MTANFDERGRLFVAHNGKTHDLVGWDFFNNDNDPQVSSVNTHGTDMASGIGAVGNNGIDKAGLNWAVRIMPVRILEDNSDGSNGAAWLDYAVTEGASISCNVWGNNTYSQATFDAIDRARQAGHLVVAAAGNTSQDIDATPFYPAAYNLDNIISVGCMLTSTTAIHSGATLAAMSRGGLSVG